MCDVTASECSPPVADVVTASPSGDMLSHASVEGVSRTVLHLTDIHIGAEYDAPRYCAKLLATILRLHPQVMNAGAEITRPVARLSEVELIKALRKLPAVHAANFEESMWISSLERAADHEDWAILACEISDPSDGERQSWLRQVIASVPRNQPLILVSREPFPSGTDFSPHSAPVVVLHGDVHFQSDQSIWNVQFQCHGPVTGLGNREEARRAFGLQRSVADYSLLQIWPDGRSECSYRSVAL